MIKLKIILLILMFLIVGGITNAVTCEISEDNITYAGINSTRYMGCTDTTSDIGIVNKLDCGTGYYIRCKNTTTTWGYETFTTESCGVDEMIIGVTLIFIFLTSLIVYALVQAKPIWLKTCWGLALNIMVVTLLRLSSWFVSINNPTELNLINTLDTFYMFAVWGLRTLAMVAGLILVIMILKSLVEIGKGTKKKDNWENL